MSASPIDENVPPPPEEERPPVTMEEKVQLLEEKVAFLMGAHQHLFLLVKALGEMKGIRLKNRQVPGGLQFYWEEAGRIVLPGRSK